MVNNEEILLKERIQKMLRTLRCTISRLSDSDTLRARYGRQINGDAAVPISTVTLLLRMFPEVSPDWLLMGEGEMFRQKHTAQHITKNEVRDSRAGGNINVGTTTIESSMQRLLDEKDARIAELEKDKAVLQNLLTALTASPKK